MLCRFEGLGWLVASFGLPASGNGVYRRSLDLFLRWDFFSVRAGRSRRTLCKNLQCGSGLRKISSKRYRGCWLGINLGRVVDTSRKRRGGSIPSIERLADVMLGDVSSLGRSVPPSIRLRTRTGHISRVSIARNDTNIPFRTSGQDSNICFHCRLLISLKLDAPCDDPSMHASQNSTMLFMSS